MEPLILAIDTSCDETSAAVTQGRRVLSNVISSQISIHKKYGGVFPALAKRAHQERIDYVVKEAIKRAGLNVETFHGTSLQKRISAIAVTQGPGLAIALEVGIRKAKQIVGADLVSARNQRATTGVAPTKLIAVNHMEGHIYSCLALPSKELVLPALCLLVSGGHTELVLMANHGQYKVLGQTLDDACGEALDKAAKILKLGYPGGPIIERLAQQISNFHLTPPLKEKNNLNFSYSGLKTQFFYLVSKLSEKEFGQNLANLAAAFQEAAFEQLIRKTSKAIEIYQPKTLLCGGGVMANIYLRKLLRLLARKNNLPIFFPANKKLVTDNAAMIGVAAWYKYQRKEFIKDINGLDRIPRLSL